MQLRGMEGRKLQFTTWILLLEHLEVLVLTKKLGRSSLYDWFDERGELQANYKEAANLGHHPKKKEQNLPILDNYPMFVNNLFPSCKK